MKTWKLAGWLVLALGLAAPALGHHAAAGIDRDSTVTVEGTVTQFRWANPHCWIEMQVLNDQGAVEVWNLEMLPPSYLIRAGWTRSTVKSGDRIQVTANPFFDRRPGGVFVSVTLPDGRTLGQR